LFAGESKQTVLLTSGTRKPQAYFSSKKNAEEWVANFLSGDEKRFVTEIPCTPVDFKFFASEAFLAKKLPTQDKVHSFTGSCYTKKYGKFAR
jgi:hypothetical protein